jgi:hypothetical protein
MTCSVGHILAVWALGCTPMSQIAGDRPTVRLDGHTGRPVQLMDKRDAVVREHEASEGAPRGQGGKGRALWRERRGASGIQAAAPRRR